MPWYPDRRKTYKGASPNDFLPGAPKFDNPVKERPDLVRNTPAFRGAPPREKFRVTTAPPPPEPPPLQPIVKPIEPIPSDGEIENHDDSQPGTPFDGDMKDSNEI